METGPSERSVAARRSCVLCPNLSLLYYFVIALSSFVTPACFLFLFHFLYVSVLVKLLGSLACIRSHSQWGDVDARWATSNIPCILQLFSSLLLPNTSNKVYAALAHLIKACVSVCVSVYKVNKTLFRWISLLIFPTY